jgi:hypothetical protein
MNIVYDVIAKRHRNSTRPNVCLFYDEDREKAIRFMKEYDKKNGFSIQETDGRFTIANLILRERTTTGETISETPYIEIFDIYGNRRE